MPRLLVLNENCSKIRLKNEVYDVYNEDKVEVSYEHAQSYTPACILCTQDWYKLSMEALV